MPHHPAPGCSAKSRVVLESILRLERAADTPIAEFGDLVEKNNSAYSAGMNFNGRATGIPSCAEGLPPVCAFAECSACPFNRRAAKGLHEISGGIGDLTGGSIHRGECDQESVDESGNAEPIQPPKQASRLNHAN
jgi:hypothetical protein